MILASDLKLGMCQFCGDTRGAKSTLYSEVGTKYLNYAIRDIEQQVRMRCKQPDFMFAEFTIDTDVSGVLGDYPLPVDFAAPVPKFAGRALLSSGLSGNVDGMPLKDIGAAAGLGLNSRRTVWTIHGTLPQRYVRFYPSPLTTGIVFTLQYARRQPEIISDNDYITVFPAGDGWEQIFIFRMSDYAMRFGQAVYRGDPDTAYQKALSEKVDSINADSPETNGEAGHLDDVAMIEFDIERGRCNPRGSR